MTEAQWLDYSATLRTRPLMPDFAIRDMTLEDRRAIYQFVRSLGPGGQPAPAFVPPGQNPAAAVLRPGPPARPADRGRQRQRRGIGTLDHLRIGIFDQGNGISHFYFFGILDAGDDIAYIACLYFCFSVKAQFRDPTSSAVYSCCGNKFNLIAFLDGAVQNPEIHDDSPEAIENTVEDQGLQGASDCLLETVCGQQWRSGYHLRLCRFASGEDDIFGLTANQFNDLIGYFFDHRAVHIDLIDDRDDLEVIIDCEIQIGDGLRLNALGGVYQQQSAFAGGQCAAYFIAEIYVTGGIDQVQNVFLPSYVIVNLNGVALDGDAFFPFQVHIVQYLVHHVAVADGGGDCKQPVCQGTFTVINMGDDAKIADILH